MIRLGGRTAALSLSALLVAVGASGAVDVVTAPAASAAGPACAAPGSAGAPTGPLTGVVNTYYPLAAAAAAGDISLAVGAATGAADPIAAGDELLVLQVQGATLDTDNSANYGAGSGTGRGATGVSAGTYEYVRATGAVDATGHVAVAGSGSGGGLLSAYAAGPGTAAEVVRVPQYSSATLGSGLTAAAWDSSTGTGGVLAVDVAGTLALNGATVDLSGRGFAGGPTAAGAGDAAAPADAYVTPSTEAVNGPKGEGIAGSPGSYAGGDRARGAPGNAGGGGTDGDPVANDDNSGGGGGGNGGIGGTGGNTLAGLPLGGLGGDSYPTAAGRALLGGGGGAGSLTAAATPDVTAAGGRGGGIALIRVGGLSGSGALSVAGAAAPEDTLGGAGGGGAGGTAIVTAPAAADLSGLAVDATGGAGGNTIDTGVAPGAGGGGAGGVALSSSALSTDSLFTGGAAGIAVGGATATDAQPGGTGVTGTVSAAAVPGVYQGSTCSLSLSGAVFDDANADGVLESSSGEGGVSGGGQVVTVSDATTGTVLATTHAGSTGAYLFTALPSTADLVVSTPAITGLTASTPLSATVPAGSTTGPDFGFYAAGSITGTVFDDGNGDQVQDNLEEGRQGVTVTVTPSGSATGTQVTPTATGTFGLSGLAPGSYTVTLTGTGVDDALVTTGSLSTTVTVVETGPTAPVVVGLATPADLTVQVYEDANGNGVKDVDEVGDPAAVATLSGPAAYTGSATPTLVGGTATLTGIVPGTYTLAVTGGAGQQTTQDVTTTTATAGSPGTLAVGFYNPHQIVGTVFNDVNGDGSRGATEPGLGAVQVQLLGSGGVLLQTTQTVVGSDGSAAYSFGGLPPGDYTVAVQLLKSGYVVTTANATQAVTLDDTSDVTAAPVGEQLRAGALAGKVYDDATGSGAYSGQALVTGPVTVTVHDPFGNTTTLQTSTGSWSLGSLPAGAYTVSAAATGRVATTPSVSVTVGSDGTPAEADTGLALPVTVAGAVYDDADGSTTQGPSETGRAGVTVSVTDTATGALVGPANLVPDADGSFSVAGLAPGSYTVTVGGTGTTGQVAVTQGALVTKLAGLTEGTQHTVDVGIATLVGLDVTVYDDANANAVQDSGEGVDKAASVSLSGPAAFADQGKTLALDPATGTATVLVPPGAYTVTVGGVAGQVATQTSATTLTLVEGQPQNGSVVLGYYSAGSLAGVVYDDTDGNGAQAPGERAPAGVTSVHLANRPGTPAYTADPAVDPATGRWSATGLAPGSYAVTVPGLAPGLVQTQATNGTQAAGAVVTVAENAEASDVEGFVAPATLSGTVYDDVNANGTKDAGEGGFAGAGVTVTDLTHGATLPAVTVTAGAWTLGGLLPGSYQVSVTGVSGAVQTQDSVASPVTLAEGASLALANGYYRPASLGGEVFEDANGNGTLDAGEVGLDNRAVSVARTTTDPATGTLISTPAGSVVTSGGGLWSLSGLPPGTYTVSTTAPSGVTRTTADQTVTVAEGRAVSGVDLGTQQTTATLSGTVFNDLNGDGVKGSADAGLPGLAVTVANAAGTKVGSATTGSAGQWSVSGLPGGTFTVTVATPAGSVLTTASKTGGADPATVTVAAGRAAAPLLVGFRGTNIPPVFTATQNNTSQTVNSGSPLVRLTATDANSDPLSYAVTAGTLPAGVRLNTNGTFAGSPVNTTNSGIAYAPVTVTVSDGQGGTATTQLSITVLPAADTPPVAVPDTAHTTPGTSVDVNVLANDTDANGDPLTLVSFTQGSRQSGVTCTAAGVCTYLPVVLSGTETFGYTVSDNHGGIAQGVVTVTIDNVKPSFTNAPANTAQSVTVGGGLLAVAAADPNGDTVTYALTSGTLPDGITALNPDGTFAGKVTTPGTSVLTISADDGKTGGGSPASTTLTVTVLAPTAVVDNPPIAVPDTFPVPGKTILPATSVVLDVLANDTDADSDPLSIASWDTPTVGATITGIPDPKNPAVITKLLYSVKAGFVGVDTFTYVVSDGRGGTDVGKVTVTVSKPMDNAPYFTSAPSNSAQEVASGSPLIGLQAADPDGPGDQLTYSVVAGSLPVGVKLDPATGEFDGTPTNATDQAVVYVVTVQVSDGTLINTPAQVLTITVDKQQPVDHPPVANDDTATTGAGQPVTVDVLANDTDPDAGTSLTITSFDSTSAKGGTVSCATPNCTYTPKAGFSGDDTFTYSASDGPLASTATVTVTVGAAPLPTITARDDTATTTVGTTVVIPVTLNDTDSAGLTLSATGSSQPAHGAVDCSQSTCRYTPAAGFTGNDTFTYTATLTDPATGTVIVSAPATVTVAVVVPVAPTVVAAPDAATTPYGTKVTIPVTANDSDSAKLPLSVVPATQPVHGQVTCSGGSCTYAPDALYSGTETFTYAVSDGQGGNSIGTVTVTVQPQKVNQRGIKAGVITGGPVTLKIGVGSQQNFSVGGRVVKVTGQLPAGLTLSKAGVLTGTPTAAGIFTSNVIITLQGVKVQRKVTITVVAGGAVTTVVSPPTTTPPVTTPSTSTPAPLPFTGAAGIGPALTAGAGLVLLGLLFLVAARRRSRSA